MASKETPYGKNSTLGCVRERGTGRESKDIITQDRNTSRERIIPREREGRSKTRDGDGMKRGKAEWVRMKGEGVRNGVMKEEERGEKEDSRREGHSTGRKGKVPGIVNVVPHGPVKTF